MHRGHFEHLNCDRSGRNSLKEGVAACCTADRTSTTTTAAGTTLQYHQSSVDEEEKHAFKEKHALNSSTLYIAADKYTSSKIPVKPIRSHP